jgi:hypothetical protein
MVDENRAWTRQGEAFWRAHHEASKRSDLNQRQYCEAEDIPLKAFGNWRAKFKAEPQPEKSGHGPFRLRPTENQNFCSLARQVN